MKKLIAFAIFVLLLFMPVILYTKLICDFEDFEEIVALERYEQNKKIEELEKRIRILETDVTLIQYGFDEEEKHAE